MGPTGTTAISLGFPRALHPEEVHATETKAPKKVNHIFHEHLSRETCQCQSSSQWGYGEGNKRRIIFALLFLLFKIIIEFEVLEVRKESNEIQDLSARALGISKGEEPKGWREVSKVLSNVWHIAVYLEGIYPKLLEVRKGRKVTQGAFVKPVGAKFSGGKTNAEPLDEWKQSGIV